MIETPLTDVFEKEYYFKSGDDPDIESVIFEHARKIEARLKEAEEEIDRQILRSSKKIKKIIVMRRALQLIGEKGLCKRYDAARGYEWVGCTRHKEQDEFCPVCTACEVLENQE